MKDNDGFTLIEILAAILILSILLTIFLQLFVFSQKTTTQNKKELVALNLAETVLERMISQEGGYQNELIPPPDGKTVTYTESSACGEMGEKSCIDRYHFTIGDREYDITIIVYPEQENMGLYPVEVQVYHNSEKPLSKVKGFVAL